MRLMAGPLAPSESKMRFMNRLGLDLDNHNHRRLYKAMKSDAVASYLQMTGQRDALLPQLQGDKSVVAPYTYAQVSETALHRAILGMYARADDEIRAYYDLGRNTDGIEEENWVIRWLLWHVFRYRDRRNRAGVQRATAGFTAELIQLGHSLPSLLDTNLSRVHDDGRNFCTSWYAEGHHPAKWSRDGGTYLYAFFYSSNTLRFYTLGLEAWQPSARIVPCPWWIHPDNGIELVLRDVCVSSHAKVAAACTNELLCVDIAGAGSVKMLPVEAEVTSVDWLTRDTMLAGQVKNVRLWDVRTKDSTSRIHHKKRVTGVQTIPGSDGTQILVSDNHGLKLYDLRMTSKHRDRYPLAFAGTHGGPHSKFDTNRQGLVVAYMDEQVKVLSLKTGRQLRDLELPSTFSHSTSLVKSAAVKQLSWEELSCSSPFIQICTPTELWRWTARSTADD
ncbi:hypothetical protein AMS68_007003 [Peltaster fructicola]|uniref:Uncharacterized protein n=1 Tax=Peltaster fructicola TaxID=286661 RepID=A0A6H0Y3F8_9PEZI|nr:hypothetical protein AMS68_007003 [Peltaster fructicola]